MPGQFLYESVVQTSDIVVKSRMHPMLNSLCQQNSKCKPLHQLLALGCAISRSRWLFDWYGRYRGVRATAVRVNEVIRLVYVGSLQRTENKAR